MFCKVYIAIKAITSLLSVLYIENLRECRLFDRLKELRIPPAI